FVSNKMSTWNDTNQFPHNNFIWRGIDGTEVFACVPPVHFISWMEPAQVFESWNRFLDKDACDESLHMFGYGDGGSGVTEEMLALYQRLKKLPGLPRLRLTTGREYLHSAFQQQQRLATWEGELYLEMHRGTFTTKAALKRENRRGEFLAFETEVLCTIAALTGADYPLAALRDAWKKLLLNQFHDILPGSHTAAVYWDALESYKEMKSVFATARDNAIGSLTRGSSPSDFTFFNPFSFPRDTIAELPCSTPGPSALNIQKQYVPGGAERWVVRTGEVQPFSFARWDPEMEVTGDMCAGCSTLASPFFELNLDDGGSICRIVDKVRDREVLAPAAIGNEWQLFEDKPGVYNAWDLLETFEEHKLDMPDWSSLEVVEEGPLSAAICLRRQFYNSRAEQVIRVYAHVPRIDFETFVSWHESERILKVAFPVRVKAQHYLTDTSAGALERPIHRNTSWEQAR
ncbi:MAG TPA: alpha-mannosidase, partial [Desulfobacterales bacterium]|nr:alpha-mannosidase [Desulfobacterales bacterium]